MRVFISADIEGIAVTASHDEGNIQTQFHAAAAKQMTEEVVAACEGAISAGADYILVKDAHGSARNIDPTRLPECVDIIRGWSGSPFSMADGVQDTAGFDAAFFIGYHAACGRNGNALSHTISGKPASMRLNGLICSEFLLYSWAAASVGVPTVLLTGDKMLCEDSENLHPMLKTVVAKEGYGGANRCVNPRRVCTMIREAAREALSQDLSKASITLPKHYCFEVTFKNQTDAVRASFYPGFTKTGDCTVTMNTDNLMDVLTSTTFIL